MILTVRRAIVIKVTTFSAFDTTMARPVSNISSAKKCNLFVQSTQRGIILLNEACERERGLAGLFPTLSLFQTCHEIALQWEIRSATDTARSLAKKKKAPPPLARFNSGSDVGWNYNLRIMLPSCTSTTLAPQPLLSARGLESAQDATVDNRMTPRQPK